MEPSTRMYEQEINKTSNSAVGGGGGGRRSGSSSSSGGGGWTNTMSMFETVLLKKNGNPP